MSQDLNWDLSLSYPRHIGSFGSKSQFHTKGHEQMLDLTCTPTFQLFTSHSTVNVSYVHFQTDEGSLVNLWGKRKIKTHWKPCSGLVSIPKTLQWFQQKFSRIYNSIIIRIARVWRFWSSILCKEIGEGNREASQVLMTVARRHWLYRTSLRYCNCGIPNPLLIARLGWKIPQPIVDKVSCLYLLGRNLHCHNSILIYNSICLERWPRRTVPPRKVIQDAHVLYMKIHLYVFPILPFSVFFEHWSLFIWLFYILSARDQDISFLFVSLTVFTV